MYPQRTIGHDGQLQLRMFFTMFMLGLVYAAFILILWRVGIPIIFLVVFAGIFGVIQFFASEKIVLASMRAKIVDAQQEPFLHQTIERLSLMAGMPKPRIAVSEIHVPNAFATGRTPRHAVVAVTRGIMQRLTDAELEAVLAHELTHIKNRDVQVMTIASFFLMVISILLHSLLWMGIFGGMGGGMGGGRGRGGGGQAAMVIMVVLLVSIVTYVVAQLLIMALSRYRELAADRGGAILTGQPENLARALIKIQDAVSKTGDRDLREVKEGASAFFIIPALKKGSMAAMFGTHPPVEERVRRLRQMQQDMEV